MDINEKAKAYDATMKAARQWIKDGCTDKEKICLECCIAELRESEDEEIRKEIISALKFANDGGVYDKHIAYLERQKEPKTASNIEDAAYNYANNFSQYDDTIYSEIVEAYKAGAYYMELKQQKQKPNIKSKSLAELREKVIDFFDSAELTEEVKIKDVTDGKCLFVYIDEDDGPVIGIGQRILRGMCDDIKQLI